MPGIDISSTIKKSKKKEGSKKTGIVEFLNRDISFGGNLFSNKKKLDLFNDMHLLLSSGIDIKTAFELIIDNINKKAEKEIINKVKKDVINGESLSVALEKTGKFTRYEVYSIRIGEETGRLNEVLKELVSYFGKRVEQKRKIVSAFSYPMIIMLTAFGAIFFMMQFIVPMFEDVFKRFDSELPALTQFIINVSHSFKKYFLAVLTILIGLLILRYIYRKNELYRKYSTKLLLRMPIFGQLIRKINLARFCLGMELLLSARTPILNAVQLIQKMVSFYPIESSMTKIENDLLNGIQLYQSMSNFKIYDKRMVSLIKVAEEVNQLDSIFTQLKDQYNADVEYLASNINSVMEPILIIFIGVFVGLILISMYLPMFQLSSGVSF